MTEMDDSFRTEALVPGSTAPVLRRLRDENVRLRRMREAIRDEDFNELDQLDEGEDKDIEDIY